MEDRSIERIVEASHYPRLFASIALGMLALFLLAATIAQLKEIRYIGSGIAATNTISVSGQGEVFAVPDIAQFNARMLETATDVKSAQTAAAKKINDITAYLKGSGVDEKDVQTTDYSVNPQYEYQTAVCKQSYCPPGKQVLTGYQASETITVKVRDTSKAGELLAGVGSRGTSSVSGLDFTVADQDALDAEARDKAIADAKTKAQMLAKSLGVSLVRVVSFSENGSTPIPFTKAAVGLGASAADVPVAPQISTGQNKITSNVSITYEIQ